MKTKLSIEVEFDGDQVDAASLASVADSLLQTALSTPGVLHAFGNPQFGKFVIEADESHHDSFEQEFGTEESCPENDDGHEPDWASARVKFEGDVFVDVNCKNCGRSVTITKYC